MKLKKYLEQALLCIGFALLAFFAGAKLHGHIMSRAAIQSFDELQHTTVTTSLKQDPVVPPVASPPSFVSWSERRIRQYEESWSSHVAPALAVIRIARIHVEAPVLEGTDDITLNRGVGHISTTARFGENGNVGIAGHRDGFFRGLKNIRVGDPIEIEEPGQTETYVVDRLQIVSPENVSVLRSNDEPALTLVTCYPFYYIGKAPRRFIVHAVLAGSEPQFGTGNVPTETRRSGSAGSGVSYR
jgi:sortase A